MKRYYTAFLDHSTNGWWVAPETFGRGRRQRYVPVAGPFTSEKQALRRSKKLTCENKISIVYGHFSDPFPSGTFSTWFSTARLENRCTECNRLFWSVESLNHHTHFNNECQISSVHRV